MERKCSSTFLLPQILFPVWWLLWSPSSLLKKRTVSKRIHYSISSDNSAGCGTMAGSKTWDSDKYSKNSYKRRIAKAGVLVLSYAITCCICQHSCWTTAVCIVADILLIMSLHREQTCLLNLGVRKMSLSALIVYLKISWSALWWWYRILFPGGRKYNVLPTLKLKICGNKEIQTTLNQP